VTAPASGFLDALRAVARTLDGLGEPGMIIGGVAVIARGVPRLTVDIDATVAAADVPPAAILAAGERHGIAARIPDAVAFARQHHVLLCAHTASGTDVDISLAWLPFEAEALAARETVDFAGVVLPVARAEDLVIYKLVAARPRDVDDAEGLLLLHARSIDLARVRRVVTEFAALLEDDERPRLLERLLRKVEGAP